jgi:hypothetical protein
MVKKRRTKQDKIIANLRRQLKQQEKIKQKNKKGKSNFKVEKNLKKGIKTSKAEKREVQKKPIKPENTAFSYPPKLIKKSLIKTLILSLFFQAVLVLIYYLGQIKNLLPF